MVDTETARRAVLARQVGDGRRDIETGDTAF